MEKKASNSIEKSTLNPLLNRRRFIVSALALGALSATGGNFGCEENRKNLQIEIAEVNNKLKEGVCDPNADPTTEQLLKTECPTPAERKRLLKKRAKLRKTLKDIPPEKQPINHCTQEEEAIYKRWNDEKGLKEHCYTYPEPDPGSASEGCGGCSGCFGGNSSKMKKTSQKFDIYGNDLKPAVEITQSDMEKYKYKLTSLQKKHLADNPRSVTDLWSILTNHKSQIYKDENGRLKIRIIEKGTKVIKPPNIQTQRKINMGKMKLLNEPIVTIKLNKGKRKNDIILHLKKSFAEKLVNADYKMKKKGKKLAEQAEKETDSKKKKKMLKKSEDLLKGIIVYSDFRSNDRQSRISRGSFVAAKAFGSSHAVGQAVDIWNFEDAHEFLVAEGFNGGFEGVKEDPWHYTLHQIDSNPKLIGRAKEERIKYNIDWYRSDGSNALINRLNTYGAGAWKAIGKTASDIKKWGKKTRNKIYKKWKDIWK